MRGLVTLWVWYNEWRFFGYFNMVWNNLDDEPRNADRVKLSYPLTEEQERFIGRYVEYRIHKISPERPIDMFHEEDLILRFTHDNALILVPPFESRDPNHPDETDIHVSIYRRAHESNNSW